MHMCSTVFDKGTKVSQWRRDSLLKNAAWTIKYAYAKKRKTMTLNSYQVKIFISLLSMGLNISESENHSVMSNSLQPHGLYSPWNSLAQNTGMGSLSLLQGIFPTQGSNPGLLHCRQILYQLSHKGSPRILEWVAYPFSNRSSWPRNRTGISLHRRWILYQLSY